MLLSSFCQYYNPRILPCTGTATQVEALAEVPVGKSVRGEDCLAGKVAAVMTPLCSLLVATATGMCVTATPVFLHAKLDPSSTMFVPKTVNSSNLRFVFPVGLEGTGHHYFQEVENHLFTTSPNLVRIPTALTSSANLTPLRFPWDTVHNITALHIPGQGRT